MFLSNIEMFFLPILHGPNISRCVESHRALGINGQCQANEPNKNMDGTQDPKLRWIKSSAQEWQRPDLRQMISGAVGAIGSVAGNFP